MRLLLTSAGITNRTIANALRRLAGKRIMTAFIPTAANADAGDKSWLIKNYEEFRRLGPIDIVDISGMDKDVWLPRLRAANVIVFGGGNTLHLMKCVLKSGLKRELRGLLKRRTYVGISAGSIIAAKRLSATSVFLYSNKKTMAPRGLGYVDFNIRPHLNSPHSPKTKEKYLAKASKKVKGRLYALDDSSAIVYADGNTKVISEGKWKVYQGL